MYLFTFHLDLSLMEDAQSYAFVSPLTSVHPQPGMLLPLPATSVLCAADNPNLIRIVRAKMHDYAGIAKSLSLFCSRSHRDTCGCGSRRPLTGGTCRHGWRGNGLHARSLCAWTIGGGRARRRDRLPTRLRIR